MNHCLYFIKLEVYEKEKMSIIKINNNLISNDIFLNIISLFYGF